MFSNNQFLYINAIPLLTNYLDDKSISLYSKQNQFFYDIKQIIKLFVWSINWGMSKIFIQLKNKMKKKLTN